MILLVEFGRADGTDQHSNCSCDAEQWMQAITLSEPAVAKVSEHSKDEAKAELSD